MAQQWKKTLSYITLPQILPRLGAFVREGFSFVAFSIASVFVAARILPPQHPFANPANIGRFGVINVMAHGAQSLHGGSRAIDQILIYITILLGLCILGAQIFLFGFSLFAQAAHAGAGGGFASYFETANPEQDIAFMLMDRVFGIPDMFQSCVSQNVPCFPSAANPNPISEGAFPFPYHTGLQVMLSFYSYGLLILATIILCYYVISIVIETAKTGTAFGKRFSRAWAPIRLVVALGLLIPVSYGLNGAQYITLQVAKWGSSFATNGWTTMIGAMNNSTPYGAPSSLVARPQYPTVDDMFLFLATASTCKAAYERIYGQRTGDNAAGTTTDMNQPNVRTRVNIRAWLVRSGIGPDTRMTLTATNGMSWEELSAWSGYGDMIVVFGDFNPADPERHRDHIGRVMPLCGQVTLPVRRGRVPGSANGPIENMAYYYFYYFIFAPWEDTGNALNFHQIGTNIVNRTLTVGFDANAPITPANEVRDRLQTYNDLVRPLVDSTYAQLQNDANAWVNDNLQYGWAGAAVWYNRVAQINADFTEAVLNIPFPSKYPYLMEYIAERKGLENFSGTPDERFEPHLANGERIQLPDIRDYEIIKPLGKIYTDWSGYIQSLYPVSSGNAASDTVAMLFQSLGLWSFRANEIQHPMANLVVLGRALVIKSIGAFGLGMVTHVGTSMAKGAGIKSFGQKVGGIITAIANVGLISGVVLNYIVPLMPFIYFFFAVATWIKTIFEAMIGVPLWALSHLRYDRDGLPGPKGLAGYYLLIDIFIRPILIVFGLVMSSVVFFAMVRTLNNLFVLVVSNLSGFDVAGAATATAGSLGSLAYLRGHMEQLLFTVLYIVIVYMIGLGCFKMIDQVPANVLRWMGASINTFAATAREDAGATLSQSVKQGSSNVIGSTQGLASQLSSGGGG